MRRVVAALSIAVFAFGANVSIKTVKVADESYSPKKEFFAKTAYKEGLIKEITPKVCGQVEKLYVNEKYVSIKKGEPLFRLSYDVNKTQNDDNTTSATKKTTTVYSPYSGIVIEKQIYEGSFVDTHKPVFRLVSTSKLWVEAKIYEKDASGVKIGDKVSATFTGSKKSYVGKIEQILPEINDKDRTLTARATINSDGFLKANMFGKASIIQNSKQLLTLPKTAILDKGKKQFVFVKVDKKFEPQEIKAIKLDNTKYKIVEGLSSGDEVASEALFMLDSDAKINGLY